jgi:hypothetical protein
MKVQLLVNLKVRDGRIISAGSVFSDEVTPMPEFIEHCLNKGRAKIIDHRPSPLSSVKAEETKVVEAKLKEVKAPSLPDRKVTAAKKPIVQKKPIVLIKKGAKNG